MTASEELLADLHDAVTNDLLEKIQNGEATASELNVARQLLKDNDITAVPSKGNNLTELEDELPDVDSADVVVPISLKKNA